MFPSALAMADCTCSEMEELLSFSSVLQGFLLAGLSPELSGLFLFLWFRICCSVVSISWVISFSVNLSFDGNSGTVAWNSLVID